MKNPHEYIALIRQANLSETPKQLIEIIEIIQKEASADNQRKAIAYDQLETSVNNLWDELEAEGNDYGLEQFGELVLTEFGLN